MSDAGVKLSGLKQAQYAIKSAGMSSADWHEFYHGPGQNRVREFWQQVFDTEGAILGQGKWAPIALLTHILRTRRGHGRAGSKLGHSPSGWLIGRDTNVMMSSFVKRGSPDGVSTPTGPASWLFGTMVPYAHWFHYGRKYNKVFRTKLPNMRKQPPRPLVVDPMPRAFITPLEAALQKFVERKLEAAT